MPAKITDLPQVNAVSNSDLLIVETNPNSTPNTKTITIVNFKSTLGVGYHPEWTPANSASTTGAPTGAVYFDNTHIYVKISANNTGRVALEFWTA